MSKYIQGESSVRKIKNAEFLASVSAEPAQKTKNKSKKKK